MRVLCSLAVAIVALTATTAPVWAFAIPQADAPLPTQHQLDLRYADHQAQPYAMNYTDEAAQKLGVRDGKWEAFDPRSSDPLVPSVKGGMDGGRPMISLQWRPGQ
jgi:hypothetical protein